MKRSLTVSPYAVQRAVLVTCATVKEPKMLFEFLVDSTVLMVDSGLPDSMIKSPDAKSPNMEQVVLRDTPERPKNVHKNNVAAVPANRIACVMCSFCLSLLSSGKIPTTNPIVVMLPNMLDMVTCGSHAQIPYASH
jgi:hypothetical protein